MNNEIRFACSNCEQKMMVDLNAAGLTVDCPNCGTKLLVPMESEFPDPAAAVNRPRQTSLSATRPGSNGPGGAVIADGTATMQRDLIAASVQATRLESELSELRQVLKRVRTDLARTVAERDEANAHGLQLEEALEEAQKHYTELQWHYNQQQNELAEREADVAYARSQLTETQSERTAAKRENQALEERISAYEHDLTVARAELAAAAKVAARLERAETEIAQLRTQIGEMEKAEEILRGKLSEMTGERDSLARSVSESGLGQELISVREQFAIASKERDHLQLQARQLTKEIDSAQAARAERDETIRHLRKEFEEARKAANAVREDKMHQDNEVLRGIIARQNAELADKHTQLVRLKRARLGVQLAYAAFALALMAIAYWALQMVPGLKIEKLLDF